MARTSGLKRTRLPSIMKGLGIPHQRGIRTGPTLKADTLPSPATLGVGSMSEVKVYLWLRRKRIPFQTQQNFDGGANVMGGQRADFVLPDYHMIIEVLGYFHYTPGQELRDNRKWDNRRRDGWQIVTVDPMLGNWQRQLETAVGIPVR